MKNKEMLWKNNGVKMQREIKVIGQVFVTDYSQTESAEGQRPLVAKGVKQISDSYDQFGICSCPVVIKRNNKYIVIDGQNRIEVAKRNGWGIPCTLIESDCSINDLMMIMNSTGFNWGLQNYLNNGIVYAKNPDYILLSELWEDTGIPLCSLIELFSHKEISRKRKSLFERGAWKITTGDFALKVINYVEKINKYMTFSYKTNFIRGFAKCVEHDDFDINHFITQLKRFPNHIHDSGDKVTGHRAVVHKIYNNCTLSENQITLDV